MKYFLLLFFLSKILIGAEKKDYIRFLNENDAYLLKDSDKYFTGGFRLEYFTNKENRVTYFLFKSWNEFFIKNYHTSLAGFHFGNESYTPSNILKANLVYGDRPYASRLYLSNSLSLLNSNSSILSEIEIGAIGPALGGNSLQTALHKGINSPVPEGWDSQIPNFATFKIKTERRKFYTSYFGYHSEINLGSISNFSTGLIFRIGNVGTNPGMGFSQLQPGTVFVKENNLGKNWYIYFNPGVSIVGYNSTLQGNYFSNKNYQSTNKESVFTESTKYLGLKTNSAEQDQFQEYILKGLLEDNGRNSSARYVLYEQYFVKNTNNPYGIGVNYILFNNIFNSSQVFSNEFKIYLLQSLLNDDSKISPELKLITYYSLFKPAGKKIPEEIILASYQIVSDYIIDPNLKSVFLQILYESYFSTKNKTYTANPERIVGFFRLGFHLISKENFFFGVGYSLQSLDFKSSKGLPNRHEWAGFQVGINF